MSEYREVLQRYVDMSYEELLSIAQSSFSRLITALNKLFVGYPGKDPTSEVCVVLLSHCLGADGTLTEKECRFVNDLLGARHSCEALMNMIRKHGVEESEQVLHLIIDVLDPVSASDFVLVGLCILAVDETINRDEVALFQRLMA